jgi:hypothetical protein
MKKLLAAVALATLIAVPAFAATPHARTVAPQARHLYMYAPGELAPSQAAGGQSRDAAMRDCNAAASKWSNSAWETTQLATYGTCMTEHGQTP